MKKENIEEIIDKRIVDNFISGFSTKYIIEDLESRIKSMSKSILEQNIDLEKLINMNFEELTDADFLKDKLPITRTKYTSYYIKHSMKRVKDIDWVINNSKKFPHLSKSQVFKLIKLKEKLSRENSVLLSF